MTIGQLARATGVPVSTIRFWERRGLLQPATKVASGRRYRPSATLQIALLLLGQDVGFTLREVQEFQGEGADAVETRRRLIQTKLADIDTQITRLEIARERLTHAVRCDHEDILACPTFQRALARYLETLPSQRPMLEGCLGNPTT
ncbi:MAG: MerR family DNA-binding transcriptional regulator [Streptosporangiales bacterium]|nr:MerR family DNA-binding transcriptional regulator [Streptosporangiales bacterium]